VGDIADLRPHHWSVNGVRANYEPKSFDSGDPREALKNVDLAKGSPGWKSRKFRKSFIELFYSFFEATVVAGITFGLLELPKVNAWLSGEAPSPVSGGLDTTMRLVTVGFVFLVVFWSRTQARVQRHLYPSPRELFQKFTSQLPGMVYQCRVSPTGQTSLIYCNDAIEWIYEKDPEEMRKDASPIFDLVHPDDKKRVWTALTESATTLQPWREEYRVVLPRQGVRWRYAHALVERMPDGGTLWHGFIFDITTRKEAEEAMRRSEERLNLATHAGNIAVWEYDFDAGQMIWSDVTRELVKAGEKFEPAFDSITELIHSDDRPHVVEKFDRCRRSGELFQAEFRITRYDGVPRVVSSNATFIAGKDGKTTRVVGALMDVTEMRDAEKAAKAADRAKSDFLAMMSHEIRTPMNGVLGFTSLLKASQLNGEQSDYVRTIERSAENLLALINDILDLAKIESGRLTVHPANFDLSDFVEGVYHLHRPLAREKKIEYSVKIADGTPESIRTDRVRLGQVLNNLLGNAIKFTETGSVRLDISAVRLVDSSEWKWRFSVLDTGAGISDEMLPKVFESFYQVEDVNSRRHQGSGLGLAISRRLSVLLNGSIGVTSKPGVGSEFILEMTTPGETVQPPELQPAPVNPAPTAPLESKRILIVEDNPINRKLCLIQLNRLGCKAVAVENGMDAIEKCKTEYFDAVLMDVQLPDLDGYETTKQIRKWEEEMGVKKPVPIIATTANAMLGDRERCLEAGMSNYISKPLKTEALAAMLIEYTTEATE
jgi:PAS domain S-box-containing protein